jgi:hypothetical protein
LLPCTGYIKQLHGSFKLQQSNNFLPPIDTSEELNAQIRKWVFIFERKKNVELH